MSLNLRLVTKRKKSEIKRAPVIFYKSGRAQRRAVCVSGGGPPNMCHPLAALPCSGT